MIFTVEYASHTREQLIPKKKDDATGCITWYLVYAKGALHGLNDNLLMIDLQDRMESLRQTMWIVCGKLYQQVDTNSPMVGRKEENNSALEPTQ